MNLNQLREEFPGLKFSEVSFCFHPRNEDACYQGAPPAGWTEEGAFIRIENPWGGGDTVPAGNGGLVRHLAAWHQGRVDLKTQKAV